MREPQIDFDILVLTRVRAEAFLTQLMEIDRDVPPPTWGHANFLSELPGKWDISHIALHGSGQVAGYIIGSVKAEGAHIHRVAVAEQWRLQGLGMRLMGAAAAVIKRLSIPSVTCKVHKGNGASQRMMQRLGWKETGGAVAHYLLAVDVDTLISRASLK